MMFSNIHNILCLVLNFQHNLYLIKINDFLFFIFYFLTFLTLKLMTESCIKNKKFYLQSDEEKFNER
jgi:hypothetical protein